MANEKKYELTSRSVTNDLGHTMYRIKALRDFTLISGETVRAGDLGGYIESEENLSHEGSCWVGKNAVVFGDTPLLNTEAPAKNNGTPRIVENAYINGSGGDDNDNINGSTVSGNVVISGNAFVLDSHLSGNAKVGGYACVIGNSMIGGSADICGNAFILSEAKVIGDVTVNSSDRVYGGKYENTIGSGSEFDLVINDKLIKIYKAPDNSVRVNYAKNEFAVSEIESYSPDSILGRLAAKSITLGIPVIPPKIFLLLAERAVKNMEVFK